MSSVTGFVMFVVMLLAYLMYFSRETVPYAPPQESQEPECKHRGCKRRAVSKRHHTHDLPPPTPPKGGYDSCGRRRQRRPKSFAKAASAKARLKR